jgi:hypothetical protein
MRFLDTFSNEVVEPNSEEAKKLFLDKRYGILAPDSFLTDSGKIEIDDPSTGDTYQYDLADIEKAREEAIANGGILRTRIDNSREAAAANPISSMLTSALLGVTSAATMGASDVTLGVSGMGARPGSELTFREQAAAAKEEAPIANVLGEAAGYVALPGGPAARAAGALAKLGPKAAMGTLKEGVVRGASEGIVGGLQQTLSNVSLSDAPMSAEGFANEAIRDVLFGGVMGAGLPVAGAGLIRGVKGAYKYGARPATIAAAKLAGERVISPTIDKVLEILPGTKKSNTTDLGRSSNKLFANSASYLQSGDEKEYANQVLKMSKEEDVAHLELFNKDTEKAVESHFNSVEKTRRGVKKFADASMDEAKKPAIDIMNTYQLYEPRFDDFISGTINIMTEPKNRAASKGVVSDVDNALEQFVAKLQRGEKLGDAFFGKSGIFSEVSKLRREMITASKRPGSKVTITDIDEISRVHDDLLSQADVMLGVKNLKRKVLAADETYHAAMDMRRLLDPMFDRGDKSVMSLQRFTKAIVSDRYHKLNGDEFVAALEQVKNKFDNSSAGLPPELSAEVSKLSGMIDALRGVREEAKKLATMQKGDPEATAITKMAMLYQFAGLAGVAVGQALTNPAVFFRTTRAAERGANALRKHVAQGGLVGVENWAAKMLGMAGKRISERTKNVRKGLGMAMSSEASSMYDFFAADPKAYEEHVATLEGSFYVDPLERHTELAEMNKDLPAYAADKVGIARQYLLDKSPRPTSSLRDPTRTRPPSSPELRKYAEIAAMISNPYGEIAAAAEQGRRLSDAQLQALMEVYPVLYREVFDTIKPKDVSGISSLQKSHKTQAKANEQKKSTMAPPQQNSIQRATSR